MAVLKCKMCGGDLEIKEGMSTCECEYCGSVQTIPKLDDEKKLIQFERANKLRFNCEFDKAAGVYENIVSEFRDEAEAYWGLVLCKFGIEYVDDPLTAKKIPTCHRSSFESVMEDEDLELALENADIEARRVYRDEAKKIETLRRRIIDVSQNEEPYDIFICYKETDESGARTLDSVIAQDVYKMLTNEGYRVFFSRISLEDKIGQEYEPYIFAALNSAKIMLAFGTDYEYYNAVWVKNEWSRYLKLMTKDSSKHLIPCYKNLDAYDIPKEFNRLQAQDIGKIGAEQDLLRGIEKLIGSKKEEKAENASQPVVIQNGVNTNSLLQRGYMALDDGEWSSADEFFEMVLNQKFDCAEAYLGKTMATFKIKTKSQLMEFILQIQDDNNFKRTLNFADDTLKSELEKMKSAKIKEIEEEEHRRTEEEAHRREEAIKERKENINKIKIARERIAPLQNLISTYHKHTACVMPNGTAVAVGDNQKGQCNVSDWRNIVAVSAGSNHTVGLKSDGTVIAAGSNYCNQCDISCWRDIIAISAGSEHTVGLKRDGAVVAVGNNYSGQCDVSSWIDIVAVSAGNSQTLGLKSDGTVVVAGDNTHNQCNVSEWKNIVAISVCGDNAVGLKSDGTVISNSQLDITNWKDIVAVNAGFNHTVGIKLNGTVVVSRCDRNSEIQLARWSNIVCVSGGLRYTVGLKLDGTLVSVGDNVYGQCDVLDWKLFNDMDNIEEEHIKAVEERKKQDEIDKQKELARQQELEKQQKELAKQQKLKKQQATWRSRGLCQHCGGNFEGLFSKKCSKCGKPKDY